jgi:ketosteroid isomerase-like protein
MGSAAAGILAAASAATGTGCAAGPGSTAGSGGGAAPTQTQAEAEAEIKTAVDTFYDLARRRDWDAVGRLFAPNFRILTDGAETFDKPSYLQLLKADDLEVRAMELTDLDIHVTPGSRVGWVRFHGYFEMVSHGTPSRTGTAETLIFERQADGAWRIAHAHASIKALDVETANHVPG